MAKKTTIYDIAKKLNITAATVSRALNNNSRISESTKKLVKETAIELKYKPNKLALALKIGKSKNIGVIVPRINRNFFSSVIRGIEEELYPSGYHVIMCQTYDNGEREIENVHALLDAQVDGIFISLSNATPNHNHLKHVIEKNIPLILFDRVIDMDKVSYVKINDFKGAYDATVHLIKQGCKKIAHLTGDQSLNIYSDRLEGYKKALFDHNIKFENKYVIQFDNDREGGNISVKKLLKLDHPPDAIFSASDHVALGVIKELKSKGYMIPKDFCVIGFSNEPFTNFMEMPISSVDQFPLKMGKMVAKVFLEQVDGKIAEMGKKVVIEPKLFIKKSSDRLNLS